MTGQRHWRMAMLFANLIYIFFAQFFMFLFNFLLAGA